MHDEVSLRCVETTEIMAGNFIFSSLVCSQPYKQIWSSRLMLLNNIHRYVNGTRTIEAPQYLMQGNGH